MFSFYTLEIKLKIWFHLSDCMHGKNMLQESLNSLIPIYSGESWNSPSADRNIWMKNKI